MLKRKSDNSSIPIANKCANTTTTTTTTRDDLLTTYCQFLAAYGKRYEIFSEAQSNVIYPFVEMSAIFEPDNPASPSAYNASQTALLLMDYQNLVIDRCGATGEAALNKAIRMREWALKHRIMVVHSIVDVHGAPPETCKGAERINRMLAEAATDKSSAEERPEIAFNQAAGEYVVLKHPGFVSALRSKGAMELLKDHGIRSLILCGLSTSGCVLRTAMPATDDGFVVSVIEDACADPVDGLHETLVKSVLPSRAHVVDLEGFIARWEQRAEA